MVVWLLGVNKPSVEHFSLVGRATVVRCDNLPPVVFFLIRTGDDSSAGQEIGTHQQKLQQRPA